jgi:hypothetical protein
MLDHVTLAFDHELNLTRRLQRKAHAEAQDIDQSVELLR